MSQSQFLTVAMEAAKRAGAVHKKYFQQDLAVTTKASSFDLLTVADLESEKTIVSFIQKYFPDHNIVAEENTYTKTDAEYTWIIDPLDGTNNFASHLPIFCVSIALSLRDEVILGVVYDVMRDELFWAEKDKGAFVNNTSLTVASASTLTEALLITGFYYDRGQAMIDTLETIKRFFLKDILGLRRLGAAALDLCYVASGRVAGFWEFELNPWDFAAGLCIIKEAGGKVSTRSGETVQLEKSFIVASNAKIHDVMLNVIATT